MRFFRGVQWWSFFIGWCAAWMIGNLSMGRWLLAGVMLLLAAVHLGFARVAHDRDELARAVADARLIDAALDAPRLMTPTQLAAFDQLRARFRAEFGHPK